MNEVKLRLETTAPFQGLAELVAYDEGLFKEQGIEIEWMDREKGVDKSAQMHITNHKDAGRYLSHGKMMEQGLADLYNACEWGNYSRVETSKVGSRQVGRRSIVTFAALVVRGDSKIQTPQQFANVPIGVPMYSGTHYLCLQMLEGFVPRELIKIGRVPNGSNYRFKMLMDGTIEATTLTEPYISLAEKLGCRVVISSFHHGTEVASDRVTPEIYGRFNKAVREAVRRINANKSAYMHYFIDYYRELDPQINQLKVEDLRPSRLYLVDPAPIPQDELQRTYDWMKSWGFLETGCAADNLVNMEVSIKGTQKDQAEIAARH